MKNILLKLSVLKIMKPSNFWLIFLTIALACSCDPKGKKQVSYLDEALQKTPDAFFERALVG
ncbi:MAG: hypothetical protein KAQ62_07620, partial [Cyclobacteriaceae bacterium]|nr:hypothetical protein [Cyclobacteriaceae bacterium]